MKLTRVFLLLLLVFVVLSCGPRVTGYAVLLWPEPDSALSAGDILPVLDTSRIQNTVTIQSGDSRVTVSATRLSVFESETAAQKFHAEFLAWQDAYARSMITALPIRASADRTSTRLYRLRDGEVIKIIGRTDEQSNEAGLVDYWYNVLTDNGVTGWVFGRNLELVSAGGRALTPRDDQDHLDRLVQDIGRATWRPEYFLEMSRTGRINLERFSPRFGMFGDPESRQFQIVMPAYRREITFQSYSTGANPQTVQFHGTDLTLELRSDERLRATFLLNDRQRTENFVLFSGELEDIIQAERARRQQLLAAFLARGNGLISTAFGSMEINERGIVSWEGFDRLVPDILPSSFNGTATLEFSLFIADGLFNRYDGALRFTMPGGTASSFLYTITDDGVRLVYLPSGLINENNLVTAEPASPVILFFRYYNS